MLIVTVVVDLRFTECLYVLVMGTVNVCMVYDVSNSNLT